MWHQWLDFKNALFWASWTLVLSVISLSSLDIYFFQKFWTSICKTWSHIARKSANLEYQHFNTLMSYRNADIIIHMVMFPRAAFVSNAFIFPFIVVTPFTGMTWNRLLRWSKGLPRMWIFFLFPHLPCFFLVCQHESKLGQKDLRW